MKNGITRAQRFVGPDVHAETIAETLAEREGGEPRSPIIIPNREQNMKKLLVETRPEGNVKSVLRIRSDRARALSKSKCGERRKLHISNIST